GGVRALAALGLEPGVFHLNEGHSAFAPLEAVRMRMENDGASFADGFRDVAQQTVFTTHTPVAAGHDRFDAALMEEHLGPLRDKLGISHDHLMSLGRVNTGDAAEPFCMTVLALKASRHANGVSNLHGKISRQMWAGLWPSRVEEQIPIGHITNGVHVPTWVSSQMLNLFNRYFPNDWAQRMGEPDVWSGIYQLDPGELWETHQALKTQMLSFVRRRLTRQARRRGEGDEQIDAYRNFLDPNILTVAFARRFATYKRATLLADDIERLDRIVNDPERPVQLIFSGKAHPADLPGKAFIKKIAGLRFDSRFAGKIVFVEDYDMNVARHLVQGADVWLNNPRRPLEASGTSGQKAVLNGALNLSILDGWWAEAYDGSNGFAVGTGTRHVADDVTDHRDSKSFYDVLEKQVVPLFYDRDADGLPYRWIARMKHSVGSLAWRFSAHRMVQDYVRLAYVPAAGGVSAEMTM
ncbi:MAG TPA: alpha-glucan family phosphorylase, partial [Pirellulales bacterium]